MAMSWKTAGSSWMAAPPACATTKTSRNFIWASATLAGAAIATSSITGAASAGSCSGWLRDYGEGYVYGRAAGVLATKQEVKSWRITGLYHRTITCLSHQTCGQAEPSPRLGTGSHSLSASMMAIGGTAMATE